ncbi:hypothetical protein BDV93DRAFT_526156 [Ceratobasidium sp. AG-I]|nr:hypothetical protein BDV93DRAFT_526156 [Ceratobasidium sp. AG-I]
MATLFVARRRLLAAPRCMQVGLGVGVGGRRGVVSAADKAKKLEEQQLDAMERMASTQIPADFDLKAQKITVLDLNFPVPISRTPSGLMSKFAWAKASVLDRLKSIYSLRIAYKVGVLPPPKPSLLALARLNSPPLTSRALSAYTSMNDSFARGDLRTLARACSEDQFERLRQRIRTRPGGNRVVWEKEGEGKAEIMSVRTVDAWQSKKPEDHLTQALVRFDTRQSVAVYGPGGKLLSGDPKKFVAVREYLVLEKKNWQPGDWMLRDQLHPPK